LCDYFISGELLNDDDTNDECHVTVVVIVMLF